MEWFKKYYEKLLLAASLLVLIGVALYLALKINYLSDEIHNSLNSPSSRSTRISVVDLSPYSNAIAALQSPSQWTNANAMLLFPPRPVAPLVSTNTPTIIDTKPVIRLLAVTRRPFRLLFMGYNAKEKGVASDFQVNFRNENRTFFVKNVGDEIGDAYTHTGYVITNFEQKIVWEDNPSVGGKIARDLSLLTVQHEGEPPIVLVHGRLANHPRRYARIQRPDKPNPIDVGLGDTFEFEENTYKVVDIGEKEVVLLNLKSGKKQAFSLPAPVRIQSELKEKY